MKHINFINFLKKGSIHDLIKEFQNYKWQIGFYDCDTRVYHWPNILLAKEKKIKFNQIEDYLYVDEIEDLIKRELFKDKESINLEEIYKYEMHLLGQYHSSKKQISLYLYNIQEIAKLFCKENINFNNIEAIECLTEVVLIHEMVHFIVHKSVNEKEIKMKYSNQEEVYFHEGVAQFFTHEVTKAIYNKDNNSLHSIIFEWLNKKQIKRYRVFRDILKYKFEDIMAGLTICSYEDIQEWSSLITEIEDCSHVAGTIKDKIQACM